MTETAFDKVITTFKELQTMEIEDLMDRGYELLEEKPTEALVAAQHEFESRVAPLYETRGQKVFEIVQYIASQLGYLDLEEVDFRTLIGLVQEASEAINNWSGANLDPELTVNTPLKKLLQELFEIDEEILRIEDDGPS